MLTKHFAFEVKELSDSGRFEGWASVYGNKDEQGDIVMPGAFAKSLQRQPSVPILYQHNTREPIGLGNLTDAPEGLKIDGNLVLDVPEAKKAYSLMRAGVLKGLSIGYRIPEGGSRYDAMEKAERLTEIDLHEVSVVTFAANRLASITGVKDRAAITTIREFEEFLRDSGFSKSEATALASGGWKAIKRDADTPDVAALNALLQLRETELRRFQQWN
jgi:HK97 family phage prohead protease